MKPHEHVESLPLNHGLSVVFRCDRAASEDLSCGGVMIACATNIYLHPAPSISGSVECTGEATAAPHCCCL